MQINSLSNQFGACAQINVDDIKNIAEQGYKSIINFRPDLEGGADQPLNADLEAQARMLGLSYFYLPVIPNQIQASQVQECAELLKLAPQPILGFCRTGNRVTNIYHSAVAMVA